MVKKKPASKFNFKNLFAILITVLPIILIFAFIDYLIHSLSAEYAVPSYYFRNKIIFGTIIGFFALLVYQKLPLMKKSLLFSATISILLQIRYFYEGYPLNFVLEFLFIHFIILLPLSLIVFYLGKKFSLLG